MLRKEIHSATRRSPKLLWATRGSFKLLWGSIPWEGSTRRESASRVLKDITATGLCDELHKAILVIILCESFAMACLLMSQPSRTQVIILLLWRGHFHFPLLQTYIAFFCNCLCFLAYYLVGQLIPWAPSLTSFFPSGLRERSSLAFKTLPFWQVSLLRVFLGRGWRIRCPSFLLEIWLPLF